MKDASARFSTYNKLKLVISKFELHSFNFLTSDYPKKLDGAEKVIECHLKECITQYNFPFKSQVS